MKPIEEEFLKPENILADPYAYTVDVEGKLPVERLTALDIRRDSTAPFMDSTMRKVDQGNDSPTTMTPIADDNPYSDFDFPRKLFYPTSDDGGYDGSGIGAGYTKPFPFNGDSVPTTPLIVVTQPVTTGDEEEMKREGMVLAPNGEWVDEKELRRYPERYKVASTPSTRTGASQTQKLSDIALGTPSMFSLSTLILLAVVGFALFYGFGKGG